GKSEKAVRQSKFSGQLFGKSKKAVQQSRLIGQVFKKSRKLVQLNLSILDICSNYLSRNSVPS
ncbi:hypothetical protein, partial [Bacillus sp. JJ1474]|uniref:hypothetical protein n=1 Tax=Bacillus sp. JJ1474 TaxID=3122955 RepID=UPI002FFDD610